MLSCILYRKRLGAYLDEELPREKRMAVENHLKQCVSCRTALEALQGLGPVLQTIETPYPPSDMISRIMSEARDLRIARARKTINAVDWGSTMPWAWAFRGATAVAVILGLTMGSFMSWNTLQGGRTPWSDREISGEPAYTLDALGDVYKGSLEAATMGLLWDEKP
jgi:predicted anti-sigma-YlaC factor YlaD